MNAVLEFLLALPALILLALALFLLLEVFGAFAAAAKDARKQSVNELSAQRGPVAIVIPAHNEGANITPTLEDVKNQMRPGDRLIVVADNCDDETAAFARAAGAEVLERNDATRRGKGYALQFGLDALKAERRENDLDAVFFIDADCRLGPDALDKTVAAALASARPAQALYLMNAPKSEDGGVSPLSPSPRHRVAAFAWLLINKVRMSGLAHLFGFTRLTGSGLALPWRLAAGLDLASGEIVEDLALTLQLMNEGAAPVLVADARVTSEFPLTDDAAAMQRARWEQGSMRLAKRQTARLLARGLRRGDLRALAMAMDLAIPPLTVFAALLFAALAGGAILLVFGITAPLIAAFAAFAVFAVGVIAAWIGFGREALPPAAIGAIIPYFLSKRKVYGARARQSTKSWTRTERDG